MTTDHFDALEYLTGKPIGPENCFMQDGGLITIVGSDYSLADLDAAMLTPEFAAWRQARIDAHAAAESARMATPLVYDQPIQARIETPALDGHVYGLEVDPTDGGVFTVQRESTRLTQPEYDAAKAAILAARKAAREAAKAESDALKAELDGLKAKLATAEADIVNLKKAKP